MNKCSSDPETILEHFRVVSILFSFISVFFSYADSFRYSCLFPLDALIYFLVK